MRARLGLVLEVVTSPGVVAALCIPSLVFVFGGWLLSFVPEEKGLAPIFLIAGFVGFILAVASPLLTLAAVVLAITGTAWRRSLSPGIVAMWLMVVLSVWANFRIAAAVKACCV
jgi:hypothetical protein